MPIMSVLHKIVGLLSTIFSLLVKYSQLVQKEVTAGIMLSTKSILTFWMKKKCNAAFYNISHWVLIEHSLEIKAGN